MRIAIFPPLLAMLLALVLMPVPYPEWREITLLRLGSTIALLALISAGLHLRPAPSAALAHAKKSMSYTRRPTR